VRKVAAVKGMGRAQALANIKFRIGIRKELLKESKKRPELLSAEWVIASNNKYVDLTRGCKRTDYGRLFKEWRAWLKAAAK
jgi:hypothetical protein